MKVLNLYAGLGGNRRLWGGAIQVTAVEIEEDVAMYYSDQYPNDTVVVGDAHEYLVNNFEDFDFIWSSPPCPSHGQYRYNVGVLAKGFKPLYPDMRLYEEIIFLKHHFKGKYVVENTIPYYKPLVEAQKVCRHLFWANFLIPEIELPALQLRSKNKISELQESLDIFLDGYHMKDKRQKLRNCVNPILGKHVFDTAVSAKQEQLTVHGLLSEVSV